jgi:hydroxymethylpyrimidine pyrophosphatase-like HAD family hydrolase
MTASRDNAAAGAARETAGKAGIVFCDVDGTLCFHAGQHGIRELERRDTGSVLVEDPATGGRHEAVDVSVSSYRVYLAHSTEALARRLAGKYEVVLVTGGRPATLRARMPHLDFADAFILENGGLILDRGLEPDREWYARLESERRLLGPLAARLEAGGWVVDAAGRTSALRVRRMDNPARTAAEFEQLCAEPELPDGLKKTFNLENLDIILGGAGKDKAVSFWLRRRGFPSAAAVGIGDDLNDIPFLEVTGRQFVLCSSFPEVVARAQRDGWTVSTRPHFAGIDEILARIVDE